MHNPQYYEIMMNGQITDTTSLGGIAFMKYQSALLIDSNSKLVRRFCDEDDKVLHFPSQYNSETGAWEPLS